MTKKKGEADNKQANMNDESSVVLTLYKHKLSWLHRELSLDINAWLYSAFQFRLLDIISLITYGTAAC